MVHATGRLPIPRNPNLRRGGSTVCSARVPAATAEKVPFGARRGEGGGALVGVLGLVVSAEPREQIGSGCVEGAVGVELELIDQGQRDRSASDLGDCDGAVEGDHRRRSEDKQLVVKRDDLRPIGLLSRGRGG